MSTAPRRIHLGAFLLPHGHHVASWRHPQVDLNESLFDIYRRSAQIAERALFDTIFFADSTSMDRSNRANGLARGDLLEPLTALSAIAASTRHIGVVGTASTTYNEPYHVARKFASLDQISGGRAGWNLVTTDNAAEAHNFGRDEHMAHAARYARAREFYDVVTGLWDSWDEDAVLRDKAAGRYFDPAKVHDLDHRGQHFAVSGPLNVVCSPQGRPIVVQAGSSETGRDLAARSADVVFTAQSSLGNAQKFYSDLKGRLPAFGRLPDDMKIMPGIVPVVGRSVAEAQDKFDTLQNLVDPRVGIGLLGRMAGNFDLTKYPLDGPLPELPITETGQRSRQELVTEAARKEGLTIRQLYLRIAAGRGHFTLIGTAETVADQLQEWFEQGGADGFNIMAPVLPAWLEDFATQVVPELQRRGLFRTAYEGRTLRENLGLPPHRNRYTGQHGTCSIPARKA